MKKFKRIAAFAASAVMAAGLFAACGSGTNPTTAGTQATTAASGKTFTVGVVQLVQHEALDAATEGFQDKLIELLSADGYGYDITVQNASGDSANCATIANSYVADGVDLIMANATAALIAASQATADIPVLGTSVTNYATAFGIDEWTGGMNVSGTSDLAPLADQAAMFKELLPEAKTIGLLYCTAEANSAYQIEVITKELEALGFTAVPYAFTDTNDVATVTQNAVDNCDALYIPTDNTAASNTGVIDQIARPAGVPIICGEEGICRGCGIATLSISYYNLGEATAQMAYDVLVGGKDIKTMDIQFDPNPVKEYNAEICEELGITIPDSYVAIAAAESAE